MKLLYLTRENLRNTPFIKDLVFHHKLQEPSLLLHDHFGTMADTRFVTKRLSAIMSEDMITNNAFSGDQRGLLRREAGQLHFRAELVKKAFATVSLFILNPIVSTPEGPQVQAPAPVLQAIREHLEVSEVVLFPRNSLSPLASARETIRGSGDVERLLRLYDEETELLEMARKLAPVVLAAPKNLVPQTKGTP
ncbi:MAG: hypothetical protein AAF998_17660 [Bacteroidota bacterium]